MLRRCPLVTVHIIFCSIMGTSSVRPYMCTRFSRSETKTLLLLYDNNSIVVVVVCRFCSAFSPLVRQSRIAYKYIILHNIIVHVG